MYQYEKHLDCRALGAEIKRRRKANGWTQEHPVSLTWERKVRIAHVAGIAGPVGKTAGMIYEAFSGFVCIVSGRSLPISGGIRWRFCFQYGETLPGA